MNLSHIAEKGSVNFFSLFTLCWFLSDQTENDVFLAFLVLNLDTC
jgi:hypothetical protein